MRCALSQVFAFGLLVSPATAATLSSTTSNSSSASRRLQRNPSELVGCSADVWVSHSPTISDEFCMKACNDKRPGTPDCKGQPCHITNDPPVQGLMCAQHCLVGFRCLGGVVMCDSANTKLYCGSVTAPPTTSVAPPTPPPPTPPSQQPTTTTKPAAPGPTSPSDIATTTAPSDPSTKSPTDPSTKIPSTPATTASSSGGSTTETTASPPASGMTDSGQPTATKTTTLPASATSTPGTNNGGSGSSGTSTTGGGTSGTTSIAQPNGTQAPGTDGTKSPKSGTDATKLDSALKSDPSSDSTWTTVGAVGGGVVVVVVVAIYILLRRRTRLDAAEDDDDDAILEHPKTGQHTHLSYKSHTLNPTTSQQYPTSSSHNSATGESNFNWHDIELIRIESHDVELVRVLGSGASGEIWLGRYQGATDVAIKKLHSHKASKDDVQAFIDEIALLASLDCPYIVQLIGASWTRPNTLQAVIEYMNVGDLRDYLTRSQPSILKDWSTKLAWATDVAEGLVYLHSMSIIHRDLKSRNILLDTTKPAKLADFGISREGSDFTMTVGVGTCRWMAPEILADKYYTDAVDIYSFGVVMSELDTHNVPYSDVKNDQGKPISDIAIISLVREKHLRPTFTATCPRWFVDLAMQCMADDPNDRPHAAQVAHVLRTQMRHGQRGGFV
ncbi:Aste57867_17278 [Aphanomyces stellatus]|uniref:Aste57867_17278 protein n=1 Tax=Aphanomyces stellatus TaxID=120398 RepID=A0A485L7H2_9STRA|nr:hypothetical protein As57867_017219 [Aphanomyces stellatus]VFT94034.1 Aste57867_17278 [Aphanomyces stellatus]